MADDTTDQTHLEEAHMNDALNNLTNSVTSYATNLTNSKMTNSKILEQLNVVLAKNKVLKDVLSKIYMRCQRNILSEKK